MCHWGREVQKAESVNNLLVVCLPCHTERVPVSIVCTTTVHEGVSRSAARSPMMMRARFCLETETFTRRESVEKLWWVCEHDECVVIMTTTSASLPWDESNVRAASPGSGDDTRSA